MNLQNAKLKSSLKANFSHFQSQDGRKFNKIKTSIDGYGPGDSWEECYCYLEIVNGEMFCYLAESHLESYFEDFNWKSGFDDMLSDRLLHANESQTFIDKGEKIPDYIYYQLYDRELGVEVVPILSSKSEEELKTDPVIGKFKPKRKFLNFVSAVNGARIRFIRDIAFLKGEKLSGVLEGVIFKVTICDEGTINFEEQEGTNLTDESMIKRLIDEIDSMDVTGYAQKFIVSGVEFSDIDGKLCYLEVEHQKPIDKLKSLFDEEEQKTEQLSERGFSILDSLFSSESDEELAREFEGEIDEDHAQDLVLNSIISDLSEESIDEITKSNDGVKSTPISYMEEQFRRMNEEKIMELEYRIEETQKEVIRYRSDAKIAEKKAEEKAESLKVLESRLESMKPGDEPNGYVFYVSEEIKDMEGIDEDEAKVVAKIADIMKLKTDVLIEMLTGGYYKIKIAKKDDITAEKVEVTKEILEKMSFDPMGKMKMEVPGEFEYRGKLNWHQLVQKMIRSGFVQNEEFDKFCNSNSYESHEENKN